MAKNAQKELSQTPICAFFDKKESFYALFCPKIWSIQKKVVPLQSLSKNEDRKDPMGSPKILIFGESENTAKIHMSDIVANRIEP